MKLILENWNKFVNEQEEVSAGGVTSAQVLKMSLPQFVKAMQSNRKDIIQTVLAGAKDGKEGDDTVSIEPVTVKCADLRPTQAEVVFDKSIPFALKKPQVFMTYLKSNGPFKVGPPGNDAIIVLNGKFVLDGHHRWSSLFCVNPNAEMYAFNIKLPVSPLNALKLMQASIKAYAGEVPSNQGGGINLFTIDQKTLTQQVYKIINENPKLVPEYIKLGLLTGKGGLGGDPTDQAGGRSEKRAQEVAQRLLGIYERNIDLMQSNNKPVSGASSREPMPQTDAPAGSKVSAGGDTPAALKPLEKGQVDFRSPFATDKKKAAE
tara:strand:+ start:315 stop:1271 length:957 start_codon:yes stop_codon:yes gene_type:complete